MKILIAEDDLISRRVLTATVQKAGYEVIATCDGEAAWQVLQSEEAPQLAILDWMMPGMDGLQVCREVRKRTPKNYTYILMLTAKGNRRDIVEGLEAGADDYLVKPFDAHELRARLNVGRRILDLQNQLVFLCEELKIRATHDSLTGIWNRAAILDVLNQELARAERDSNPVGIVMADLDHFKRINDTYGHPAGDAVLRETTHGLQASLRPYDGVGRYGGEEFLIVLPGCTGESTLRLAERLREQVAESPVLYAGTQIPVTISIGATSYEGGSLADAMTLLQAADDALYQAKHAGRNRVVFAPTPLPALTKAPGVVLPSSASTWSCAEMATECHTG
jgi:diguanylate cyclase (GGDEF)-like protein